MNENKPNQLFIYERFFCLQKGINDYQLKAKVMLKELPMFEKVCMNFHFQKSKIGTQSSKIYFCKRDCIFTLDYETKEIVVVH